jgi:hypothetical protein
MQAADWSTGPEQAGSMGAQAGKHGMGKQQWVEWSLRFPSSPGDSMLDALLLPRTPRFCLQDKRLKGPEKGGPWEWCGNGGRGLLCCCPALWSETLGVVEEFVVALWVDRR